jgi:hypothetical protein
VARDTVGAVADYDKNVFVNCPLDSRYATLLRPLLFTIRYLGFYPRIATERSDSGESRLSKICDLIRESRYSIHDLSRLKSARGNEYYRMNMPFELGVDYGSRQFGASFMRMKRCLILERDAHGLKIALSDLAGVDIKHHDNKPEDIVRVTRDWFLETVGLSKAPYPKAVWFAFTNFTTSLYESRLAEGIPEGDVAEDIERMAISEFINCIGEWVTRAGQSQR